MTVDVAEPRRSKTKYRKSKLPKDRPIYERLDAETTAAYQVFQHFLATPSVARRLQRTALDTNTSFDTVRNWSAQHSWDARVAAWDDEQHRDWLARLAELRRSQRETALVESQAMHGIAGAVLLNFSQNNRAKTNELRLADALETLRLAYELDRRLAEEPDLTVALDDSWRQDMRASYANGGIEESEGALTEIAKLLRDLANAKDD